MNASIRQHQIETAAANWFIEISEGITPERRTRFEQWRDADPRNRVAYLRIQHTWQQARRIAELRPLKEKRHGTPITEVLMPRASGWSPRRWAYVAIATATVLATVAGWKYLLRQMGHPTETYATAVGETRTIMLADGSAAHLNTDTVIEWIGSDKERRVRLKRGEALFEVVHDSSRAFSIILDHSVIHDLGTEFNVYRKASGNVVVTVLSGSVGIDEMKQGTQAPLWHRQLTADQQLEYTSGGEFIADVHATIGSRAIRWRGRKLEASLGPLSEIISELNRYSKHPIIIAEPKLGSLPIGGTYSVSDIDETLNRLQRIAPINITRTGNEFILTHRPDPSIGSPARDTVHP